MAKEIDLIPALGKIFNKPDNFDIAGFCKPELVTVALADALNDAYKQPGKWYELAKAGYDVHCYLGSSRDDGGIVGRWVPNEKSKGKMHLKLYWDSTFPREIEKMKQRQNDIQERNGEDE